MGEWSRIEVFHDTPSSFDLIDRSQGFGERDFGAGLPQGECSGAFDQRFDRTAELRPELNLASDGALRNFCDPTGIADEFIGYFDGLAHLVKVAFCCRPGK